MLSPKPWFCAAKGKRETMEDIHIISAKPNWFLFAVCDGHGGDAVVRYFETYLESFLHQHLDKITYLHDTKQIDVAMTDMCIQLDRNLHSALQTSAQNCGSTLTFVAINRVQNKLIQVNVGDSRSVVCYQGKEMSETTDHKPTTKSEHDRIQKAGGKVLHHRVNGTLALSRAFGDFSLKKTKTSAYDCISGPVCVIPEIKHMSLSLKHTCQIIVACDGIWDTMDSTESIQIAFLTHHPHKNPAQSLVLESYKRGSSDNMTCLAISI